MDRRNFLGNSAWGAAALTVLPRNVSGGTGFTAPDDQINSGLAGREVQGGRPNTGSVSGANPVAGEPVCRQKIYLINKVIEPDTMPVLYEKPLTEEHIASDFTIYGGEWTVEDGWLTGRNPGNFAGMIISKADFFGDVMMDFTARTLLPATHDINIMWNGSWDEKTKARGPGYIIGIQGWWYGKVGFEKSPDYKLMVATPLFHFEPGKSYHIQAGSVNGHIFILVDGDLVMELQDPDPIDNQKYGKIGFEAYCTQVQIRDLKIRKALWLPHETSYTPEFR